MTKEVEDDKIHKSLTNHGEFIMYPHIKKNILITIIVCLSLLSILLSACGLGKKSNRPIYICGSYDEDNNGSIDLPEQGRIFAIDVDGEQISVKQISEPQYYYSAVKVSPTGEQIAYYSMRDDANNDGVVHPFTDGGLYNLYLANPEGSDEIEIGSNFESSLYYFWNSDGSKLAYFVREEDSWVIFSNEGEELERRSLSDGETVEFGPLYSPDGEKKVQYSLEGTFHVTDSDTSFKEADTYPQVTTELDRYQIISWSPDGEKILLAKEDIPPDKVVPVYTIYIVDQDGSNLTQITDTGITLGYLAAVWSPDGKQVVYISHYQDSDGDGTADPTERNNQLIVVNADGTGKKVLLDESVDGYISGCVSW